MSRAQQTAEEKARLTAIARRAFERDGYDAVSFRNLAKEAGVSTGAFFSKWKSKEALYADATGKAPPDVPTFLERVAIECAGDQISTDALDLRKDLIGTGR